MRKLNKLVVNLCDEGVKEGVFPGVAVAISLGKGKSRKKVIQVKGRTSNESGAINVTEDTYFDLASLTKPLVTALCTSCLVYEGRLEWQETLHTLLPQERLPHPKKEITLAQLLSHSSGLPAYKPYFKDLVARKGMDERSWLVKKIINEPLVYPPGSLCLYSDLGFILLGIILEEKSGFSLDVLFHNNISTSLSCTENVFFVPLSASQKKSWTQFAATEHCTWRNKKLQGEVHDEHAWLMNGVAGHAGLFGNIKGVLTVLEHVFDIWQRAIREEYCFDPYIRKMLRKKYKERTWCLGFDTPEKEKSTGGRYLSSESVGHLGYTGTSFWMDPERQCIIILLSNRVHPCSKNNKIKQFRPYFHDKIMEYLRKK